MAPAGFGFRIATAPLRDQPRAHLMSKQFPWYDSVWLRRYVAAKQVIARVRPALLPDFVRAFDRFRTRPDFTVRPVDRVFDDATMARIREVIRTLQVQRLEAHEARAMGRFIVHDDPWFTELQASVTSLVSGLVGETVEPSYYFLSLYTKLGVCPIHMDSPEAKWTLDLCLDQTEPWPIHFSRVVPWPEDFHHDGDDWQEWIKRTPELQFESHALEPGKAVVFSGSSQWHYRERLPQAGQKHFCNLLFFHYVPAGLRELSRPKNWPRLFDLPELADAVK